LAGNDDAQEDDEQYCTSADDASGSGEPFDLFEFDEIEIGSGESLPAAAAAAVVPVPVVGPLELLPVGLRDCDVALTSRSMCVNCNTRIAKDSIWLSYRFKASLQLKDERRIHTSCCRSLPKATLALDIAFVETELGKAVAGSIKHAALQTVLSDLQNSAAGGGAASSSGG